MSKFNKGKRHDQRTTLPPRCSYRYPEPFRLASGKIAGPDVPHCRQPGEVMLEGAPYCGLHTVWVALDVVNE